jgi:hypothetical protein
MGLPGRGERGNDLVSDLYGLDLAADFSDDSGELMAHDKPRPRGLMSPERMQFPTSCQQPKCRLFNSHGQKKTYEPHNAVAKVLTIMSFGVCTTLCG